MSGLFFSKIGSWKAATGSNRDSGADVFSSVLRLSQGKTFYIHLGTATFKEQDLLLESLFMMFQVFT